jgi:glycosyltransferase involved in cell wall biosynthesis
MRIAIDARELQGKPTGVGRFLAAILSTWKTMPEAAAHEVILLQPDGPDQGTVWEQLDLPRLVKDARADILFSPAYTAPLRAAVPTVLVIHDVSFAAHPEWFSWREGARRRTVTRLAARAAARIITVSEFSKREIVSYLGVDPAKVAVAYHGVTKLPHCGTQRPCSVLTAGSLFNRRHVPELIKGFARLARRHSEARLDIVGDDRTFPRLDIRTLARASGLGDRICLRSYVPDEELRELYARSAAFAFLSEYEGFGLTPLEAVAAGVPVLLLDTAVAREVFGSAAMYLKRPDPLLIETGLEALLFDDAERTHLLAEGERLLSRYSWTECARRVLRTLVEAARV